MQHCPVLLPESDVKVSVQCKRHVTLLRKPISRDDRNASPKVLLMSNSVDSKRWSCIKCQFIYFNDTALIFAFDCASVPHKIFRFPSRVM